MRKMMKSVGLLCWALSLLTLSLPAQCFLSRQYPSHVNNQIKLARQPFSMTVASSREDSWTSRRTMARAVLSAVQAVDKMKEKQLKTHSLDSSSSSSSSPTATSIAKKESGQWAAFFSVLSVVLCLLVLRIGGRTAFISLIGLDLGEDTGLQRQLAAIVEVFQHLPVSEQLAGFWLAWFIAKGLCLDVLTIVLAISSGILFQDLLTGTAVSVGCSSSASLLLFSLTRYFFKEKASPEIEKRPAFRAINRACQKNGFQTVFSLRLSNLLLLPVGAYNYLYALLNVSTIDFFLGITLGSIKPYLLDCYLGIFGRDLFLPGQQVMQQDEGWMMLGWVAVVALVTAFLTQWLQSTYQELDKEMKTLEREQGVKVDLFSALGIEDNHLPDGLLTWKRSLDEAWKRVEDVIRDEWKAMKKLSSQDSRRSNSQDTGEALETYRTTFSYEKRAFAPDTYGPYLAESTVFTFVLLAVASDLLNPQPHTPKDISRSTHAITSETADNQAER